MTDIEKLALAHRATTEQCVGVERDFRYGFHSTQQLKQFAEAIRERDRLGFAVVNVIGKLDEIIENTQEVEIDDFLHIAVPIDMWNELQDALEDMPKRADIYTSPQPIEKCEPVGWYCKACKETGLSHCSDPENCGGMVRTYTSPQPRDWVGLSDEDVDSYILSKGHLDCVLDFSAEHDDVTELKTELRRLAKAIMDEMERINRE